MIRMSIHDVENFHFDPVKEHAGTESAPDQPYVSRQVTIGVAGGEIFEIKLFALNASQLKFEL